MGVWDGGDGVRWVDGVVWEWICCAFWGVAVGWIPAISALLNTLQAGRYVTISKHPLTTVLPFSPLVVATGLQDIGTDLRATSHITAHAGWLYRQVIWQTNGLR